MSLLSAIAHLIKPAPPPDPEVAAALDRVIAMVDPLVRAAPRLEKQLLGGVEHALAYCAGLVDALPGPLEINRQAFASNPLVHALFATAADIDVMLGHSTAIRDYLGRPECWQSELFCAMLAARRWQKKQFGFAQSGNVIRSDVPQEVLYFSDQTLIEPHCDPQHTRERLRVRALESLLRAFNEHVHALRHERDEVRGDLKLEYAQVIPPNLADDAEPKLAHTRHIAQLDSRLREIGDAMLPEHLAAALADFLHQPEYALSLRPISLCVDRLGIVQTPGSAEADGNLINFPELSTRDRRLHIATLVVVSRADAQAAVERANLQKQRYIIV